MANRFVQRARKPNYTREETETLLDQLIVYGHFLFNKTQPVNNQQKADVWGNIAMQVNSVPNSAGRTVDELKHRWQDMAQRARAVLRKNQSQSPNDVKASPIRPVPFFNKILQVLGESHRDSNRRQEESLLASLDSIYSSDSSCNNETKHAIKEEINDQTAVDLSQSNGTKTNSLKRSHSEATNLTSKPSLPESSLEKYSYEKIKSASLPPVTDHCSSTPLYFDGQKQDQTENKHQRIRHSSSPRQSVSERNQNNSNSHHEGQRVRHQHMETSRSMVLDPESQLVMEVEESVSDERSQSSSHSASNASTQEEDNHYIDNCLEDKARDLVHQNLQQNQKLPVHHLLSTVNSTNIHAVHGSKQFMSGQPFRLHNNFPLPLYHAGLQNPFYPLSQLESLPKVELDRQCAISQIRMQDQHTRYLQLKEKKLQLEIEILQGKCLHKDPSKTNDNIGAFPTSSDSPSHLPSTSSFPTSPCNVFISNVTSCHDKGLWAKSESSVQKDRQKKSKESEGKNSDQQPADLISQGFGCDEENHTVESEQNGENGDVYETGNCGEDDNAVSPANLENENDDEGDESLPVCFEGKGYDKSLCVNGENDTSEAESKNEEWVKALQDNIMGL